MKLTLPPDRIICQGLLFQVLSQDDHDSQRTNKNGYFDGQGQIIRYNSGLDEKRIAMVILHELFHLCYWACDIAVKDHTEEHIVMTTSSVFFSILHDNPSLTDYFSKVLGSNPKSKG